MAAAAAGQGSPVVFVQSQPRSWRQLAWWARGKSLSTIGKRLGLTGSRHQALPPGVELIGASPLAVLEPRIWAERVARKIARAHPDRRARVIVYAPSTAFIVLGRRLTQLMDDVEVVYDAVVDWEAVPSLWWPPPHVRRNEASMPREWAVTSDSAGLAGTLGEVMQRPVKVVLPAADPAFADHSWDRSTQDPGTIGWFGVVRHETDVDLLCTAARSGLKVETVGPVEDEDLQEQLIAAGVTVRPGVPIAELPSAIAHWGGVLCAYRGERAGTITPAKIFNAVTGFPVFTRGLKLPAELADLVHDLPADDDAALAEIRAVLGRPEPERTAAPPSWEQRLEEIIGR